jgi:hypothetical protein
MAKALALVDSIHRVREKGKRIKRFCKIVNNERVRAKAAISVVTGLCDRYYDRVFENLVPDWQRRIGPVYHQCKALLELARRLHRFGRFAEARWKAEEAQRKLKDIFATLPRDFQFVWSEVMYI